jgi:hypothetical protein
LGAAIAFAASAGVASADTIVPSFVSVAGGGPYTWTYAAVHVGAGRVAAGDFFTIYDFAGFTGVSSAPADWTLSTALTTPAPAPLPLGDNPTVLNLTWTYSGPTIATAFPFLTPLGLFTADSISATSGAVSWGSQDTGFDVVVDQNASGATVAAVPEPSALLVAGIGLLGFALRRQRS